MYLHQVSYNYYLQCSKQSLPNTCDPFDFTTLAHCIKTTFPTASIVSPSMSTMLTHLQILDPVTQ